MEPELDQLQAPCTYIYTAQKSACYCVKWNNNTTITHHSILKQRTTAKEPCMGPFKSWCKPTSTQKSILFVHIKINLCHNKHYWCLYMHIAARNAKELQAGYLVANGTRTMLLHTFLYKCMCSCALCDILWCYNRNSLELQQRVNQAQYHQITHANVLY